jgi:biotin-(acetyl-CoA carboxylase) ligase
MATKLIETIDKIEIEEILAKYLHVFDCALKIIDTQNGQSVIAEVYERVENNLSGENTNGDN